MLGKVKNVSALVGKCRASRCVVVMMLLLLCTMLALSNIPFTLLFHFLHDTQSLMDEAAHLNSQRTQEALKYLNLSPKLTRQQLQAQSQPPETPVKFTIAVITTSRKKPANSNKSVGYVFQSVVSVMSTIRSNPFFNNSFVFVCNVDKHPVNHADAVVLKDYLPFVERYGTSTIPGVANLSIPGTEDLYRKIQHGNTFDKERHDYMFCLQAALSFNSEYYLILQDDAVLLPDFSDVLELSLAKLNKPQLCLKNSTSLLNYLAPSYQSCIHDLLPYTSDLTEQRRRIISPSPDSSFAYIKFHFPERWLGFGFELQRLLDLVSFGVVGGGVGLLLYSLFRRKQGCHLSWRVFWKAVFIFILFSYVIGRQNLNEVRRLSKYLYRFQSSPDCCIPAMLYPAPVVPFLVPWLAESPPASKVDLRIADCFHHYDVPGYYIEPNIVRHVGLVSTLKNKREKLVEEFVLNR